MNSGDDMVRISSKRLKHLEYIERKIDQIVADAVAQRLKHKSAATAPKHVDDVFVSPTSSISSISSYTK
jgi:phosphopantetheine adenylyltransferase